MRKSKQLQLVKADLRFFGGQLLHGRRRSARPLSAKEPIHLVMRSSWAKGVNSFLRPRNKNEISRLIKVISEKYMVRVYQVAIVSNHLHFVIQLPRRRQNYKTFVRVLSSQIASHVMQKQSFRSFKQRVLGQERGDPHPAITEPQGLAQQFWQFRPWTRVLYWGRDFKTCCNYVKQNTLEELGFIEYRARTDRYSKWFGQIATSYQLE